MHRNIIMSPWLRPKKMSTYPQATPRCRHSAPVDIICKCEVIWLQRNYFFFQKFFCVLSSPMRVWGSGLNIIYALAGTGSPHTCSVILHGPLTRYTKKCGLHMPQECLERFPRHQFQRKPVVSDPGMHHGTCVTHVPWCMSGSLTGGGGENVPGIPGACTTRNFTYLVRGPWTPWAPPLSDSMWEAFVGHILLK